MTIVILNYATPEVEIITNAKNMDNNETEEQLLKWGFRLDEISWMTTDVVDVPITELSVDKLKNKC